jgi:hypothetical protein
MDRNGLRVTSREEGLLDMYSPQRRPGEIDKAFHRASRDEN